MNKLIKYITEDTTASNESNKLTLVIRLLSLYYMITLIIATVVSFICGENKVTLIQILLVIAAFIVFKVSYNSSRATTLWWFIVFIFLWGILTVRMFGWGNGIQAFFVIPIVLYYFANYGDFLYKVIFSLCTFAGYIICFLCFSKKTPMIQYYTVFHDFSCFAIMFSIVFAVSLISYIFSKQSQKLENKLIEYNKKLEEKANTDPLTSLYNRAKAVDILNRLVARSSTEIFSICICDIDFFKRVNDTYGHDVGDLVLKNIASIFVEKLENKGYCARWGGEEFLLMFPDTNGDTANDELFAIREAIKESSVNAGDKEVKVTMTFGLTEFNRNQSIDENIKDADNKLYMGKQNGRDVIIY